MDSRGWILVYTRTPVPHSYPRDLASSVHFAYSRDGTNFTALNRNYGILFALAAIDANNVIHARGLKQPYIFATADGQYGIVAVKTNIDGSCDQESKGQVVLWLSRDLIKFEPQLLVDLQQDAHVDQIVCQYNYNTGKYEFVWRDVKGNCYRNTMADLKDQGSILPAAPVSDWPGGWFERFDHEAHGVSVPEGAVPGNAIAVDPVLLDRIQAKWSPLQNVAVEVPEVVYAKSEQDVQAVKAKAIYSDGSTAIKPIQWETSSIDFSQPGSCVITGTVMQEKYEFPLAVGYADPVILRWKGSYYFVSTNDNLNNIGIFVRKGKRVLDCFAPGANEYLILDRDERRGLIQTFWAPEFHICGGQLYLFFAVSGHHWGPQCHVMRLREGGEITDPDSWDDPIRVVKQDGTFLCETGITLDMTYFEVKQTGYVAWSERYRIGRPDDSGSMLYIATVDPWQPWRLTSEPVLLSRPLFGWENIEGTINNEGPYALVTGHKVYLAYSGGAANGYSYAVGLLSIEKGKDLLDPVNWYKSPTPVLSFYSVEGEYGPGHNAFYVNEHSDVMITYHAEPTMRGSKRCSAIRRVHFDLDGEPRFDLSAEDDLHRELAVVTTKVVVRPD